METIWIATIAFTSGFMVGGFTLLVMYISDTEDSK